MWFRDIGCYRVLHGASLSHPPPFDSPRPTNPQNIVESEGEDDDDGWSL
jgi:hypothetical protein